MLPHSVSAQFVNGFVTDPAGDALPDAYVYSLSSSRHAHTDERGRFRLEAPAAGDTLQISYLGYRTHEVVYAGETQISVELTPVALDLGSVTIAGNDRPARILTDIDLNINPVRSSQEVLRVVPGLFIGQHAGGGKAEQLFLRGFDLDHGTDIAISVDGLPVNMVSHAHGQGYADLHFLIPETIETIDYGKGPYAAERGNFATAGFVDFKTKDRLGGSSIKAEVGSFGYVRTVAQLDLLSTKRHSVYLTGAYQVADGPFEVSQQFSRSNLFGKYVATLREADKLSISLSHFSSTWDASGQIPERAVRSGRIDRFGAIDPTEGGTTSRSNLVAQYTRDLGPNTFVTNHLGLSQYDFTLFSNFTFFLEDPEFGDQIRQRERRQLVTATSTVHHETEAFGREVTLRAGGGLRSDQTDDSSLANTINRREVQSYVQRGDIREDNFYAFADARFEFDKLSLQPGLRLDHFRFGYEDRLTPTFERSGASASRLSPKLKVDYRLRPETRLYFAAGVGFHSNDSRLANAGLRAGQLPAGFGMDLGAEFKLLPRLLVNAALWRLDLEQEFVYVGDAGIVEPSGRTRRRGADLSVRYQLLDWLFASGDATYSHARARDEEAGSDLIPLAPVWTLTGNLTARTERWGARISLRHLGDRPATEDYSLTAEGYTILDVSLSHNWKRLTLGLELNNLTNALWNEAQFATESRLRDEAEPVEEIHFTPGNPRNVGAQLTYRF